MELPGEATSEESQQCDVETPSISSAEDGQGKVESTTNTVAADDKLSVPPPRRHHTGRSLGAFSFDDVNSEAGSDEEAQGGESIVSVVPSNDQKAPDWASDSKVLKDRKVGRMVVLGVFFIFIGLIVGAMFIEK